MAQYIVQVAFIGAVLGWTQYLTELPRVAERAPENRCTNYRADQIIQLIGCWLKVELHDWKS